MTVPARQHATEAGLRLRRICSRLREGRPIDPEDAEPLADAIDRYLLDGTSIDSTLGVRAGKGQTSARRALQIADRDQAIRALAGDLGEDAAGGNVIDAMLDELEQFASWHWPTLRTCERCPEDIGTRAGLLWSVLKLSGGRVLSPAYLIEIVQD
ncbi:hypothetical protein D3227_20575 [Mesorhizobium waimense]|uniref:Uncharacterized protein n=1 Tax=Mesorhizobium waimense TaxID=1300307 RepID=A0A3A5KNM7_9HYPH|nr:hypothetical protein [Mesorhizobium waimense]RJT36113.1 hypothetical protein D3227_20575 [Mesorhizobium waimense]